MPGNRSNGRSRLRKIVHLVETPLGVFWTSMTYNLLSNDLSTEVQNHPRSIMLRLSPYIGIGSTMIIFYGVKHTIESYYPEDTGRRPDSRHPNHGPAANPGLLAIELVRLVDTGAQENDHDLMGLLNYVIHCAKENGLGYQNLLACVDSQHHDQQPPGPVSANGSSRYQSTGSPQIVCLGTSAVQASPAELAGSSSVAPVGGSEQPHTATSCARLVFSSLLPLGSGNVPGMQTSTASSTHMVLTIDTEDSVTDVKKAYLGEDNARGSRLLSRRIELGPQIGKVAIEKLRLQIMNSMELARKKDDSCTMQFGSFAVLRYTETGPKWWKLPKHSTPEIYSIQRSPWTLLDFLPGRRATWTIRGSSLQRATLRATTSEKSEDLKVIDYSKTRSGEDIYVCEEPLLVWKWAPIFREKVYIYATRAVDVEMGIPIKLQSEVRSVKKAYWNSVGRGLVPGLSTIIMMTMLSFLGEMRNVGQGGDHYHRMSQNVAFASLAGLQVDWTSCLSRIPWKTSELILIHRFITMLSLLFFTLWRLSLCYISTSEAELYRKKCPGSGLGDLPQRCIVSILRLTTPRDVARLACVNRNFYVVSMSDLVWETMLPPSYPDILKIAENVRARTRSKKEIYDVFCNRVLLENGTHVYWLDRATGGICQSIGPRGFHIAWEDDSRYWDWKRRRPGARSTEVAYLKEVWWFDVRGELECFLSPGTYTLSWRLFYQFPTTVGPVKLCLEATDNPKVEFVCNFTPEGVELLEGQQQSFVCRWDQDNWMVLDVGEFLVKDKDSPTSVVFSMLETEEFKANLYLDGVVIRPSYLVENEKSSHSTYEVGSSGTLPIRDTVNYKSGPSTSISKELHSGYEEIEELPQNFQYLPKHLVGIDHILKAVKGKLQEASSLGLVGTGGIGKTTLAKALFNSLLDHFEYTCFLENASDIRASVAESVLQHGTMWTEFAGTRDPVRFLKGKRLLLVIDNAASELDVLAALMDVVHQDSRFVVTSRDTNLFSLTKVVDDIYEVPSLSPRNSKELLKTYAFGQDETIPSPMETYVDTIVEKCEGLPLSLEVIGKYLRHQPESVWVEAMKALDEEKNVAGFNDKLWAKLRLSYDELDKIEQNMFLDAATILYNEDLVSAKAAWSITTTGLQSKSWHHLLDLSLVNELKLEYRSTCNVGVGMHEVLTGLGRKIASTLPAEQGIRIWDKDVAMSLLTRENSSEDNLKDVVALKLNSDHREEIIRDDTGIATTRLNVVGSTLHRMKALRYLSLRNINIDDGVSLPSTLVYLSMDGVNFTEVLFSPSNYDQMAVLNLVNCSGLRYLPTTFGELCSLQVLSLCKNEDLESLPYSFGDLVELKQLTIEECMGLKVLPPSIVGLVGLSNLKLKRCHPQLLDSLRNVPRLKTLEIVDCSLRELPDTFGDLMIWLETLTLSNCTAQSALPDSFGRLRMLRKLEIVHCSLDSLPETFGWLQTLESLSIRHCSALSALPDSLVWLRMLRKLEIVHCSSLELPTTFGSLGTLESLSIRHCPALSVLPDSFGRLAGLKTLEIVNCSLRRLPDTFGDLTALKSLSIRQCCALSVLPVSFGSLPKLRRLEIIGCHRLRQLPHRFLRLQALEHLRLEETTLVRIPNLVKLMSLKTLALSWVAEPKLPTCLMEVITARCSDQRHFTFDVLDGKFVSKGFCDAGTETPQQSRNYRTELRRRKMWMIF